MKAIVDSQRLLEAITSARRATKTRSPMPILQSVLIEATGERVFVTGTNLEQHLRTHCNAVVDDHGKLLADPASLATFLSAVGQGDVSIELKGSNARVASSRSEFTFATANTAEYPSWPKSENKTTCIVDGGSFALSIATASVSADDQSSRYALGGVKIEMGEPIMLVSCDGRTATAVSFPCKNVNGRGSSECIVPLVAIPMLQSLVGECTLHIGHSYFAAQCDHVCVRTRLVEGRFPAWRDMPWKASGVGAKVPVGELLRAILQTQLASLELVEEKGKKEMIRRGTDFAFSPGDLTMTSDADGRRAVASVPIDCDFTKSVTINGQLVKTLLSSSRKADVCEWFVKDEDTAVLIHVGDHIKSLVMPMSR